MARGTTRHYRQLAVHKLNSLKALAPYATGSTDLAAYRDRLVKARAEPTNATQSHRDRNDRHLT